MKPPKNVLDDYEKDRKRKQVDGINLPIGRWAMRGGAGELITCYGYCAPYGVKFEIDDGSTIVDFFIPEEGVYIMEAMLFQSLHWNKGNGWGWEHINKSNIVTVDDDLSPSGRSAKGVDPALEQIQEDEVKNDSATE